MTRSAKEIAAAVADVKDQIDLDIMDGVVPDSVRSFSELHDHVDANEYGGFTDERADWSTEDFVTVQNQVDAWLATGRKAPECTEACEPGCEGVQVDGFEFCDDACQNEPNGCMYCPRIAPKVGSRVLGEVTRDGHQVTAYREAFAVIHGAPQWTTHYGDPVPDRQDSATRIYDERVLRTFTTPDPQHQQWMPTPGEPGIPERIGAVCALMASGERGERGTDEQEVAAARELEAALAAIPDRVGIPGWVIVGGEHVLAHLQREHGEWRAFRFSVSGDTALDDDVAATFHVSRPL